MQDESDNPSVQEQARYWLVRQHSGDFSPTESRAFEHWLGSSPAHREEYTRLAGLWHSLDDFKSETFPARTAARSYRPPARSRWFPPRQLAAGLSLGLILLIGLITGGKLWLDPSVELHQTQRGEQKSVTLADGSLMELNTETTVRVEYTRHGRLLRLEAGEALFTVNHDDGRPFEVIAGAGRIRDIGTHFNVYKQADAAVSVTVLEGAVSITAGHAEAVELVQGDRVTYTSQRMVRARDRIDPTAAGAWREGLIVFARTPLEGVMAELARYHDIEVAFASPELRQMKLSGTFGTRDLPLFLRTLAATLPLEIRAEGRFVRLAPTPPAAAGL